MDNDLMARRLRPPSEPFQPASPSAPPQPPFEEAGYWRTEGAAQPQAMSEIEPPAAAQSPPPDAPAPTAPWDPLVREDVPWDRPSDYAAQTDAATPDQPAWDRPSTVADEHMAEWAEASELVMAVSTASVAEMEAEPVTADPDDAYAPVLSEVSVPMGREWPAMNGDDVGRHDATVAAEAALAQPIADPNMLSAAPTPVASIGWSGDAPQAWVAPQPDRAVPPEAPGQTILFPDAVEPTTLVAGLGPTPPPDLFDDVLANFAQSDPPHWDVSGWEARADEPEWEVPAAIQEAYEYQPERHDAAVEASQDDASESQAQAQAESESEPIADTSVDDAASMPGAPQSVSPYSTTPAPPTPFVVRIELSIVDEAKRLANPAEGARIVGAADFTVPTTIDAQMDTTAEERYVDAATLVDIEPDADLNVYVDADADSDVEADANATLEVGADSFMPRNAAFEPRASIGPSGAAESAWIEPSAPAESDEHSEWSDPGPLAQTEPAPWAEPAPTSWAEAAAAAPSFADPSAVPPWAALRSTEGAPVAHGPLPPIVRGFAPAEPVEEEASRWAQPTYDLEPAANTPLAQASSPFAPPPVATSYAQPLYAEQFYTDLPPSSAPPTADARADAAPLSAAAPAQGQGDLWFLSTEPADVDSTDAKDEIGQGKEPSALLTGVLTIGMAVLVIVLVLVFIQLMTSLLR